MKKILVTAIASMALCSNLFAQKMYQTSDFSDKYYAKVYIESPDEVFSEGWIAIYDKATDSELLKVEADELTAQFDAQGKVSTNVLNLPYGEQSVIIYDDFNFDGIADLAIQDGQNSCYHGPSFVVYLDNGTELAYSESFTALAQEYCGMFEVDTENVQLHTMAKSGCCWHQYTDYVVENNEPKAIRIVEEEMVDDIVRRTRQEWNGSEMVETIEESPYSAD